MTTKGQTPVLGLKIGTKLAVISILISMVAVSTAAVLAGYSSNLALKRAAFERLTAVRELKAQQIENYFSQVRNEMSFVSEDAPLKGVLQELRRGVVYLKTFSDLATPESQEKLSRHYLDNFLPQYEASSGSRADKALIESLLPQDPLAIFLQDRYISNQRELNEVKFENFLWLFVFEGGSIS